MTDPNTDTSLWKLYLRVGKSRLEALMTGPESVERSVRFSSVDFRSAETPLKALEEAVYSTPMLPADFAAVTVMADTDTFALHPAEISPDTAELIVRTLHPSAAESDELITTPGADFSLSMLLPAQEVNFMRRTFANPAFSHPLQAVATYLSHVNSQSGDPRRGWALLTADTVLIACFDSAGEVTFANRFDAQSEADAAYYILASLPPNCPLMIGGPTERRNAVADIVRTYVDPVMPVTLSSNLLHLLGAAPDAPLDLLILTQL